MPDAAIQPRLNLVLLYVDDPARSRAFYADLLGHEPFSAFPTYVAFALGGGSVLGLWATSAANALPAGAGNRSEMGLTVDNAAQVDQLYAQWRERGVAIEQAPFDAVFGRTFVALDPDGHRIRVCVPDE